MLKALVPQRKFDYPKSLYSVEDTLRYYVSDKPDAVILDFFAGSGTTAHAVMRLNRQDEGRRQCILVTNNEVSSKEHLRFRKNGLRPGDPKWEEWGICEHVTKPRLKAAITGDTHEGKPVKGEYRYIDKFPFSEGLNENVEFFTMTYESRLRVAQHKAFESVAPLLWLRAGAQGRRIDKPKPEFDVTETYAVLFDLDSSRRFFSAIEDLKTLRIVYVVTDDQRGYQTICGELPREIEAVRLYESYLTNAITNANRV